MIKYKKWEIENLYLNFSFFTLNFKFVNMPIIKSAKKALRQNKKRKTKNLRVKNKMKGQIKKIKSFVGNGKKKDAQENLDRGYKAIDKAAKKGIIKKNTAARKKSKLAKAINRLNSK